MKIIVWRLCQRMMWDHRTGPFTLDACLTQKTWLECGTSITQLSCHRPEPGRCALRPEALCIQACLSLEVPTFLTGKTLQIGRQKLIYSLDFYHSTCIPDLILGREEGLCSEMAPLQVLDVSLMKARAKALRRLE